MKKDVIFLLGGNDLEMQEIKKVLNECGYKKDSGYYDKNLTWNNAKLEEYKNIIINFTGNKIYAIELNIDENSTLYKKYQDKIEIIDHHDKYINNEASLLQILKLLNLTPTKEQQLIAANDSGYIPAMECIGATKEEIITIRQRDREAQGVTKTDEIRAKNDVQSKNRVNNIDIVCATTERFSPIVDFLYFENGYQNKIIIYNDKEIVFYGFEKYDLMNLCNNLKLKETNYYYGGGDKGYFGIKENIITKEQREYMINELTKKKEPYSTHIFMFPFRFDYVKKGGYKREYEFYKKIDISERLDISKFIKAIKDNWEYKKFDLKETIEKKEAKYYSEYAYFYDYAREALYNLLDSNTKTFYTDELSYYFEHKKFIQKDKKFTFIRPQTYNKDEKEYQLNIDGVSLRVFSTGVAILSIEVYNFNYGDLESVKDINEYGRRFYAQYLSKDNNSNELIKPDFLAKCIEIGDKKERFGLDIKNICAGNNEIRIGLHIMDLLGDKFTQKLDEPDKFFIQPILDDRMFVASWYGNNGLSQCLKKDYLQNRDWYEYLFVDRKGELSVQNKKMMKNLLKQATYDRWSNYGTLWGITRYSMMLITDRGFFGKDVTRIHLETMYFQMAILLLTIRASVLRFSDEVSAIATLKNKDEELRLSNLYGKYLDFYNRLYFKEVTHQDQGIEFYDMGLKQMKIPEHIAKLDGKFSKLHDFAQLKSSSREKDAMNSLTMLGSILLIPTMVTTVIGLDKYKQIVEKYTNSLILLSLILGIVVAIILLKENSKLKKIIYSTISVVSFLCISYCANDWINSKLNIAFQVIKNLKSYLF